MKYPDLTKIFKENNLNHWSDFESGFNICWKEFAEPSIRLVRDLNCKIAEIKGNIHDDLKIDGEEWKDIFDGHYAISNLGRLYSKKTNKILKTRPSNSGNYLVASLNKGPKKGTVKIHRLVAKSFIPNPNNYEDVNHKDGNKLNNKVDNLEWCTRSFNIKHALKNGLNTGFGKLKGCDSVISKLTEDNVRTIRDLFKSGKSNKSQLSRTYGVSWATIDAAITGRTWGYVK